MDEKKGADKSAELDQILFELNSHIKKGATRPADAAPPKEEKKPDNRGEERGETPPASSGGTLHSAKISGERPPKSAPVRHIAVTAAEVVDDPQPGASRAGAEVSVGREEPHRPRARRKPRMTRREKATAVLGFLVSVFVVIGVVSTVVVGVNWTRDLVNSTALKEEFAKLIFPLVIVDVPEFDNPKDLDNSAIISSAIWAFIIDDNDKSKYPKDDFGEMTVPDVDIEPYIRKLFGNDIPIVHQSVQGTSIQMNYDPATKSYVIESTPRFLPYTPRVDKITRDKDIYTLHVSYLVPDAVWNLDKTHKNARVDKTYEYRLQKNKTGYQILSVKLLELVGGESENLSSQPQGSLDSLPADDGLYESSGESGESAAPVAPAAPSSQADSSAASESASAGE